MIAEVPNILDSKDLHSIGALLATDEIWEDGAASATGVARAVKNNNEAKENAADEIKTLVRDKLLGNPRFNALCMPKDFPDLILSRYTKGMQYGQHMDAPSMKGKRVDISFTLFLSA